MVMAEAAPSSREVRVSALEVSEATSPEPSTSSLMSSMASASELLEKMIS